MRKVAEAVLDGLHQIPAILSSVQRVLGIFKDSERLQELSDTIYRSILDALGRMLEYLKRRSLRKVMKAMIKQQAFESDLLKKIEEVAKARDDFNIEAELCHKEALKRLYDASERKGGHIQADIQNLGRIVTISTKEQERSSHILRDYLELMDHRFLQVTKELKEVKQLHKLSVSALRGVLDILRANPTAIEDAYQQGKHGAHSNDQTLIFFI